MKRTGLLLTAAAGSLLVAACGDRSGTPDAAPAGIATDGAVAAATAATSGSEPPTATASLPADPVSVAPVSSDPDNPVPLPALQLEGRGTGVSETRYWAFDAGAGTITVTATGKNSPSGSTEALRFGLYDLKANRLCFDMLGNTTEPKTSEIKCTIEKAQPVLLRLDLSAESLDYRVVLAGPVTLPPPRSAADANSGVQGAGSTDIDAPTRLASNRIKADGTGKPVSYYYAFNAGPGELTLTGDGSNTSAAFTEALQLRLYTLRSERLCELVLGNTTLDKRVVVNCPLDKRQPVILRADLSAETVGVRVRFDGAYDFEPFEQPKLITIALDSSVMFDTGKSVIKAEARTELQEAAARIRKFAGATVLVSGHTDNVGSDASNLKLSSARAEAVKNFLVTEAGIAPGVLDTKGLGSTQPVADNNTEAGRARNRRVDVVITPP